MKLEKREISLNEYDSIQDAFYTQKTLLCQYLDTLCETTCKQTRACLVKLLEEGCQDLVLLLDYARETQNKKN